MRPLIGIRSCVVVLNEMGEHDFVFYRLLNSTQYRNFILFIGQGLDNVSFHRVREKFFSYNFYRYKCLFI